MTNTDTPRDITDSICPPVFKGIMNRESNNQFDYLLGRLIGLLNQSTNRNAIATNDANTNKRPIIISDDTDNTIFLDNNFVIHGSIVDTTGELTCSVGVDLSSRVGPDNIEVFRIGDSNNDLDGVFIEKGGVGYSGNTRGGRLCVYTWGGPGLGTVDGDRVGVSDSTGDTLIIGVDDVIDDGFAYVVDDADSGAVDGSVNDVVHDMINGVLDGVLDGAVDGVLDGVLDGELDVTCNGVDDVTGDGVGDVTYNVAVNGVVNGAVDVTCDDTGDGTDNGTGDCTTSRVAMVDSRSNGIIRSPPSIVCVSTSKLTNIF